MTDAVNFKEGGGDPLSSAAPNGPILNEYYLYYLILRFFDFRSKLFVQHKK